MRTKLYKMWTTFCASSQEMWRAMANQEWYDPKNNRRYDAYDISLNSQTSTTYLYGDICFNVSCPSLRVKYPSKEYDAWNAFMTCKDNVNAILAFVVKNIKKFREYLPETSIAIDLYHPKTKDIYKSVSINDKLRTALQHDIANRKKKSSQLSEQIVQV